MHRKSPNIFKVLLDNMEALMAMLSGLVFYGGILAFGMWFVATHTPGGWGASIGCLLILILVVFGIIEASTSNKNRDESNHG